MNGVVDLWGTIGNDNERRAISVIAENTPGVKKVIDHLVFVEAYTGTVIEAPPETMIAHPAALSGLLAAHHAVARFPADATFSL